MHEDQTINIPLRLRIKLHRNTTIKGIDIAPSGHRWFQTFLVRSAGLGSQITQVRLQGHISALNHKPYGRGSIANLPFQPYRITCPSTSHFSTVMYIALYHLVMGIDQYITSICLCRGENVRKFSIFIQSFMRGCEVFKYFKELY